MELGEYQINGLNQYLTDRKQSILINGFNLDISTITCGIPEVSVLGALLFLLYSATNKGFSVE